MKEKRFHKWRQRKREMARLIICACLALLMVSACESDQEPENPPAPMPSTQSYIQLTGLRAIEGLPENAAVDDLSNAIQIALPELYEASGVGIQHSLDVIELLRVQPRAVDALVDRYEGLSTTHYDQRMFTVQVLGELRRDDALPHLQRVVWAELPQRADIVEGLSPRDFEEMIQVHAVNGVAYLRNEESDAAVMRVIQEHESRSVRISTIDAYMWNNGDDPAAAKQLYVVLPEELHPFVEMPRAHRDMDPGEFNRQLSDWRKRWSQDEE